MFVQLKLTMIPLGAPRSFIYASICAEWIGASAAIEWTETVRHDSTKKSHQSSVEI